MLPPDIVLNYPSVKWMTQEEYLSSATSTAMKKVPLEFLKFIKHSFTNFHTEYFDPYSNKLKCPQPQFVLSNYLFNCFINDSQLMLMY